MKKYKLFLFAAVLGMLFNACEYNFIETEELPPIDGGGNGQETVFFTQDILPIFSAGSCTSCHKSGGQSPDLTAENAYASIGNAKYVNVTTPTASLIYSLIEPNSTSHTHHQYTSAQAQLVLTWITEGAKNN
ncbi:hypothetical protein [Mangrovibacterium sp.]|uniref:hypothetical protein n=1 Tax=Mangrovibacterium sp. TaxID=1961364 RepID=UPI003565D4A0